MTPVRALSIRQPFAELILSGRKAVEYRTRPTRVIGERFMIYAAKAWALRGVGARRKAWSNDLAMPGEALPPWMVELAEGLRLWKPGELPSGVIVGSAVIERCAAVEGTGTTMYGWHLVDVRRAVSLRKPARRPQPVWFVPY